MTSIPHPDPALFPGLNLPPAGDAELPPVVHRPPPFSNRRLEQVHADVSLSEPTRQVALVLLRLPSGQREAEYNACRKLVASSEAVLELLKDAARLHELDQIFPPAEAEQQPVAPVRWWAGQPVEVRLYGGEDRWIDARLEEIDDRGRALVVHLDDGYRGFCGLADLRPAPLPYLTIPDGARP